MTTPLTETELKWLKDHPDLARGIIPSPELISESDGAPSSDYLTSVAASLSRSLEARVSKVLSRIEMLNDRIARYSINPEMADFAQEAATEKTDLEINLARLQSLKERLSNPADVFLPLGTIVRFKEHENEVKDYPSPGVIGVVSGLSLDSEYPIAVSVRDEYTDGWNTTYCPTYERIPTYRVDSDRLEVVGYALLPDGSEHKGFQYIATIGRQDEGEEPEGEMIFYAAGYFWRLHDFGRKQGIEVLQAYEDPTEMTWLDTGEVEAFVERVNAMRQSSPKP